MKKFIIGLAIMVFTVVSANQTFAQSQYEVLVNSPIAKKFVSFGMRQLMNNYLLATTSPNRNIKV